MYNDFFRLVRHVYNDKNEVFLHEPVMSDLEKNYVLDAIDSTFVSSVGKYVDRFEAELAEYVGVKRAVATVNGTSALQVALRLVGVSPGDEVITQALSFVATANAISYNGASPVFLDVDRDTMGLSPRGVASFLENNAVKKEGSAYNKVTNRKISAIVPMHTFGHPCRMEEICNIAAEWGVPVVEDAAEALGSRRNGKSCGSFGRLGIFSFNGNKIITAGGGGAIVTDNEELAQRAKYLTTTARTPHRWNFVHDEIGYNFRMPNLNAALVCAQLQKLQEYILIKRELADKYKEYFAGVDWAEFINEPPNCTSNYWLNTIIFKGLKERDLFLKLSNDSGIITRPVWQLLNELKMYLGCQCGNLENARWLADRIVNIPSGVMSQ